MAHLHVLALLALAVVATAAAAEVKTTADGSLQLLVDEGKDVEFITGDTKTSIGRLRRDVDCNADVTAELMADALKTRSASIAAVSSDCRNVGCSAEQGTIRLTVYSDTKQQALIPNLQVYRCQFDSEAHKQKLSYTTSSPDGHHVDCKLPAFDSTGLPMQWNARLRLFLGQDAEIPYINAGTAKKVMLVAITSVGPTITPLSDVIVDVDDLTAITENTSVYEREIEVTDLDTPAAALGTLEAGTDSSRVNATVAAISGKPGFFTLTLTIAGEGFHDFAAAKVTVTATDNHNTKGSAEFSFSVIVGCKHRLKHVRFDQDGNIAGQYGVKKVDKLAKGKFKIWFTVPFKTTEYAVAGTADGNGGSKVGVGVEPHAGYTKDLRGAAAADQYLHKEYVVVGTMGGPLVAGSGYEDCGSINVIAMTASKDDGCDNTNVWLATYTAVDTAQNPVKTPDVHFSYDLDVVNGDGGDGYPGCKRRRQAWRHGLKNHPDPSILNSQGFAIGAITDNYDHTKPTMANFWGLEGTLMGEQQATYDNTDFAGGFCGAPRGAGDNQGRHYKGQFNSVIVFGRRKGVRFAAAPSDFNTFFRSYKMSNGGRVSNRQRWNNDEEFKDAHFAWTGVANMLCSGGERFHWDDNVGPGPGSVHTRTTSHAGSNSNIDDSCSLMTLFGVAGSEFNKDE